MSTCGKMETKELEDNELQSMSKEDLVKLIRNLTNENIELRGNLQQANVLSFV